MFSTGYIGQEVIVRSILSPCQSLGVRVEAKNHSEKLFGSLLGQFFGYCC